MSASKSNSKKLPCKFIPEKNKIVVSLPDHESISSFVVCKNTLDPQEYYAFYRPTTSTNGGKQRKRAQAPDDAKPEPPSSRTPRSSPGPEKGIFPFHSRLDSIWIPTELIRLLKERGLHTSLYSYGAILIYVVQRWEYDRYDPIGQPFNYQDWELALHLDPVWAGRAVRKLERLKLLRSYVKRDRGVLSKRIKVAGEVVEIYKEANGIAKPVESSYHGHRSNPAIRTDAFDDID